MFLRNSLILGHNVVKRFRANTFAFPSFRYFSSEDPRNKYIPPLMDNLPMTPNPNFILSFKNIMFSALISGYFDPHFSRKNFLEGSKQAVEFVSNCLANEDFDTLEESNCVTPECLTILKLKLLNFTKPQQERLAVSKEDIWFHFIYQIGVIMDDNNPTDRQVEITYIAHHIKDKEVNMEKAVDTFQAKRKSSLQRSAMAFVETMEEIEGAGPELLVYRFIRNYTRGVDDSWTINGINHRSIKDIHNEIKERHGGR